MLLGDAIAAARALGAVSAEERPALLARLVREAKIAARYGRKSGRNHPLHGDGSLMAAALRHRCIPEPSLDDWDYRLCLALVLMTAG